MAHDNPTMERLEDQIKWYDRKSNFNQRRFKTLKIVSIVAAALIPAAALLQKDWPWLTAGLGVLLVVLEGLQQLNQYQANWISYRSTCESLKHEKYMYLAAAGPYAGAEKPQALLAERIESLVSQEHAKWISTQEQAAKAKSDLGSPRK